MTTNPELETERELRIAAEKHYQQLLAFVRGEPPKEYALHVKGDYERAWAAFIDKTADKAGF